jgi:hypothetical protein
MMTMSDASGTLASSAEDRARAALVVAGHLADEARAALELADEALGERASSAAELLIWQAQLGSALSTAETALAAFGKVELRNGAEEVEKRPEYWAGLLGGLLASLVSALADAGITGSGGEVREP